MRLVCPQRALSRCFSSHIRLVLLRPVPFVLLPLLSSALFSLGLLRISDALLKDNLELYTPTNARARAELRELGDLFHINDSDPYDMRRMGYIIVTAVDKGDILKAATLKASVKLWSIVQAITIDENQSDPRSAARPIDYPSLCVRFPLPDSLDNAMSLLFDDTRHNRTNVPVEDELCVSNPLLELVKLLLDSSLKSQQILMDALTKNGAHVNGSISIDSSLAELLNSLSLDALGSGVRGLLGGLSLEPETRKIAGAKALMLPYALKHGTEEEEANAEKWELKLAQFLDHFYSPHIKANWWTYETLAAESARDQRRLRHWLLPCFASVSLLSVLFCCCSSSVFSRPLLALSGVLSVALAISAGTGLLLLLRFPLTSVVLSMPFIIFSIGVDNIFILLAAWRSTSPFLSFEQRMAHTFGDAGVSITVSFSARETIDSFLINSRPFLITFLTDFLSFSVGCLTPFPSVQIFCLFCAVTLLFCYVYQMTLFAALMNFTCLREVQQRHCLTMRKMCRSSTKFGSSVFAVDKWSKYGVAPPLRSSHNLALSRFFRSHYAPFLLNKFVQSLVLFLFGFYLLISAYGCLNVEIGLEPLDLLPDNSNGKKALLEAEQYFPDHGGHLHVWMHNLSRVNLGHRRLWLVLEKEIELYEYTEFTGAADSWLRVFLQFYHAKGQFTSNENFVPRLKNFLKMKTHRKYRRDIRFTNDGQSLEASRVAVRLRFVGFQNQSRAMHLFRLLAESSELPTGVYADFFQFAEQFDALLPGTVCSIAVAGFAVVMVSLLLIPEPISALWVSFSTVSTNLGVLGLMPFLSIRLDFVSMVTIIMSIGFCVDFSAHLAYNYSRSDADDNEQHKQQKHLTAEQTRNSGRRNTVERMGNALYAVGTPICQSAATSILGVSFLAHTENYIFRSFFKTTVLVISLGLLHGLVILPVLLTLAHRKRSSGGANSENDRQQQITDCREEKWARTARDNRRRPNSANCSGTSAAEISAPFPPRADFFFPAPSIFDQRHFAFSMTRTGPMFVSREAAPSLYSLNSTLSMGEREKQWNRVNELIN
ncbi:hypothetical protein niasHT_018978 [Heterodera trifolii]|uniref:SSD domain-containing protein n=1 Tax=Heterodera trifolii TaxID=157864 RepID=A0ABD2LDP8_9BILA